MQRDQTEICHGGHKSSSRFLKSSSQDAKLWFFFFFSFASISSKGSCIFSLLWGRETYMSYLLSIFDYLFLNYLLTTTIIIIITIIIDILLAVFTPEITRIKWSSLTNLAISSLHQYLDFEIKYYIQKLHPAAATIERFSFW